MNVPYIQLHDILGVVGPIHVNDLCIDATVDVVVMQRGGMYEIDSIKVTQIATWHENNESVVLRSAVHISDNLEVYNDFLDQAEKKAIQLARKVDINNWEVKNVSGF